MDKKEIYAPVAIVGLSVAFAIVCFAVFLTNGKSAKWVARKMKIGGLLLTLSAAACNSTLQPVVTCYDIAAPANSMWINGMKENGLEIMLDTSNLVTGTIENRQGETFSFAIQNVDDQLVQIDTILAADGKFDSYSENFFIELDTSLSAGNYSLKLYDVEPDQQTDVNPKQDIVLCIKNN